MGMTTITVKLPDVLVEMIDKFVESGEFDCRSEFIRMAVRSYLVEIQMKKQVTMKTTTPHIP